MGEAKRKAEARAESLANMKRPDEAILRLKSSVGASSVIVMDPETKEFMTDLKDVLLWIDHLEGGEEESGELPETVN